MKEKLEQVLSRETEGLQALCSKLETLQAPIEPQQVKLFFDLVLNISAKTRLLEQFAYGKLKSNADGSMFSGLDQETRDLLLSNLEAMTQAKVPTPDYGKRTRTTHYDLLANLYEQIFTGMRADYIIAEDQNRENPYLLELLLIDALYKASKQKITMTISLLQVIQFIEPCIMSAMKHITKHLVNPETKELLFEVQPQYITEHEDKSYYNEPILLMYFHEECAPKMINGYVTRFAHIFNDAFVRIDEVSQKNNSSEPHQVLEH